MREEVIPIVFAVDDSYVTHLCVALTSLMNTSCAYKLYKVYVFYTKLSKKNISHIESLNRINIKVKCVDINDWFDDVNLKGIGHLSIETYYRLVIPDVLPQYDKILYLDSDLLVLRDVSELFAVDIGEYAIGAINDVACSTLELHYKSWKYFNVKNAFNAGVLLINTKNFQRMKIKKRCYELLISDGKEIERKMLYADQDALNLTLNGDYKRIDPKWNFQWQYIQFIERISIEQKEEYCRVKENPYIVHYAGVKKPWDYPEMEMADLYWECAKHLDDFSEFVKQIIINQRSDKNILKCFDEFRFPYKKIKNNSKIILYGAGDVGKAFMSQLEFDRYAKVILWVDQNYENINKDNVHSPSVILQYDFDYILVAVEDENLYLKIKEYLLSIKVYQKKIIWEKYRK